MHSKIHAHIPYLRLAENLEHIIQGRINPEVYFSSEALDTLTCGDLSDYAGQLQGKPKQGVVRAVNLVLHRFERFYGCNGAPRPPWPPSASTDSRRRPWTPVSARATYIQSVRI